MISNYISPNAITCDDRNQPWTDEKIKKKFHKDCDYNAESRDKKC